MLEVSYKIVGNILRARGREISEELDQEAQCGFRPRFAKRAQAKAEKKTAIAIGKASPSAMTRRR